CSVLNPSSEGLSWSLGDTFMYDDSLSHQLAIKMIGEQIWELKGKIVGQRLAKHYDGEMKLERTIEAKGMVLGEEVTFLATTWSKERPQGGMLTMGQGIMMTKKGEKAVLKGSGISTSKAGPVGSIRGARYLQSSAPSLSRLNNVALVFEIEIGADGSYKDKTWEWK
ncbi:MAG: hypothetical protein LUO93_08440, partial [Methanomicrobiales archaeon]|nr:hypothetical protein [Methanomicrobiales archaeon]